MYNERIYLYPQSHQKQPKKVRKLRKLGKLGECETLESETVEGQHEVETLEKGCTLPVTKIQL